MLKCPMLKLGAHLSIAGGYEKAIESIKKIGGNCLQIFSSSPRTWADAKIDDDQINIFLTEKKKNNIDPIYFHACYLLNLADSEIVGKKSIHSLIYELNLAAKMYVKGSIVHTGSFKKMHGDESLAEFDHYNSLIKNIKHLLSETPAETYLILENAGNRKIGKKIDHLAAIISEINDSRIRICLDTCHLHASGYDLRSAANFEVFLDEFDQKIGLEKLEVVHMNDSRDAIGTLRDRHENIGEGYVGIEVFKNFLNHPKTKHLPFIIETPGFDDKGPDKKNLDILKSFIL